MHDNDGYYVKPIDHMLNLRHTIEDDVGPAFDRKARWMPARVKARRYAPWIGVSLLIVSAGTYLVHGTILGTDQGGKEPFVAGGHRATMASTAETDGFLPLNFDYADSPRRSADFDQLIDDCAVRLQVRTAEVMSAPESSIRSTNRYTLILNESPTAFEFTGYADMVRKLGPSVCSHVAELSDAAK